MSEQSLSEAIRVLTEARDHLLQGSQQAGSRHEWVRAHQLMDLAQQAGALRDAAALLEKRAPAEEITRTAWPVPSQAAPKGTGYPKFFKRDGALVKQGLKRDGQDSYEHSVPREVFDNLMDRLKAMAKERVAKGKRKSFAIEEVGKGLSVPHYRVYVVVSYLLQTGLLEKAKKGAYLFADPTEFLRHADEVWAAVAAEESGRG
jgi:hypothetical protein